MQIYYAEFGRADGRGKICYKLAISRKQLAMVAGASLARAEHSSLRGALRVKGAGLESLENFESVPQLP